MRWLPIAVVAVLFVGCGEDPGAGVESPTTTAGQEATVDSSSSPATIDPEDGPAQPGSEVQSIELPERLVGIVPADAMAEVAADAAGRLGVEPSALSAVRVEAVQWSSGALGCPEPGNLYTQAIVPGYWVELSDGSTTLDYRLSASGSFKLCENPTPGGTVPGS